jgi:hypothetical protein
MMKALLVLFYLLLNVSTLMATQSPDEAENKFLKGNASFQQGNYEDAIQVYQRLMGDGYVSGPLLYNLGNAYYRQGDIARAILNYERSLRWLPDDEDVVHNLNVARLMTVDRIEPVPSLIIERYWEILVDSISISSMIVLAYIGYLTILGSILIFTLVSGFSARRYSLLSGTGASIVVALIVVLVFARISRLSSQSYGIVISEVVEVKNSPDRAGPDAFLLHGGTKVEITDRVGEWIQIRLDDGKVGWMTEEGMETI